VKPGFFLIYFSEGGLFTKKLIESIV